MNEFNGYWFIEIGDAIEEMALATDTSIAKILIALTGVCFNEREASKIKECHCAVDSKWRKAFILEERGLGNDNNS